MDLELAVAGVRLAEYGNVSRAIGQVLSKGKTSLRELDEWLSIEDVHDLLEVAMVDAHNMMLLRKRDENANGH
ncbi:transcription elongation factor GreA [Mesorhizobium sp. M7A.F.Ca.MR.228.00.0.0]|nr:transcription elongation factor GreA [Mesorhizobium sp. M7A.F.Ca.MR.245.00.0.0]RUV53819.1 transcription elongation factor GreA [Mesorhizobium sp. M7A.F.Ca.MR.228.00.0.0]